MLISVPHAGHRYSPALLAATRLPVSALGVLEDPLVDQLVRGGIEAGAAAIVAHAPRAEIDLNRALGDLDPAMVDPAPAGMAPSRRARAGLGLIPSRLAARGAIWKRRLAQSEIDRRIGQVYDPYHAALDAALAQLRQRFGVAILLDCHSMPPRPGAGIVIGDRYGASCGEAFVQAAEAACTAQGFASTRNDPYAGGEIAARHGRPDAGIHAMQIEIDRSLYLAGDLRRPGPGFESVVRLIAAIVTVVADAALPVSFALAAE